MERLTRQRAAVFSAFSDASRVLTAPEIHAHARELVPEISLSTVYRQCRRCSRTARSPRSSCPASPRATRSRAGRSRMRTRTATTPTNTRRGRPRGRPPPSLLPLPVVRPGVPAARLPRPDGRPGAAGLPGREPRSDPARQLRGLRGEGGTGRPIALNKAPARVLILLYKVIANEFAITWTAGFHPTARRHASPVLLKEAKKRHRDCQVVTRRGRTYVILQVQPALQGAAGWREEQARPLTLRPRPD